MVVPVVVRAIMPRVLVVVIDEDVVSELILEVVEQGDGAIILQYNIYVLYNISSFYHHYITLYY